VCSSDLSTGAGTANVYYGLETTPAFTIDGYNNGGGNIIQLKALDIANSESAIDSTPSTYVKPQTSDLLGVRGHNQTASDEYTALVTANYGGADLVEYLKD